MKEGVVDGEGTRGGEVKASRYGEMRRGGQGKEIEGIMVGR